MSWAVCSLKGLVNVSRVPDERRIHVTNEALQERLAGLLGGRIAEEVSYGTLGAGALSDLVPADVQEKYLGYIEQMKADTFMK